MARLGWRVRLVALSLPSVALALLLAAPASVDLILVNDVGPPVRVEVGGRVLHLGGGGGARLEGFGGGALKLVAQGTEPGALLREQTVDLPRPLWGRRTYLWSVRGPRPCFWVLAAGYGDRAGETFRPCRLVPTGELFALPPDLLPRLDEPFPTDVRLRDGVTGTVLRGLFTPDSLQRFRLEGLRPADEPYAAGLPGALPRALLWLALLVSALAPLGELATRPWRGELAAPASARALGPERPLDPRRALAVLCCVFLLHALLLVPLGAFAPWIPSDEAAFYSVTFIDPHDEGGHLAYLPSLLLDRDVDLYDQDERLYYLRVDVSPTGRSVEYWTLGTPILWSPFYAVAHGVVSAAAALGLDVTADGQGPPYVIAVGLASACFLLLGAALCMRVAQDLGYGARPALAAALAVAFSTILPYYAFVRSRLDHPAEFFAVAAAAWGWFELRRRDRGLLADAGLGLAWGIGAITRQSNVVLLAGPLLDLALRSRAARGPSRVALLRRGAAFALGLSLPVAIQLTLLTTIWGVPWSAGHAGQLVWPDSVPGRLWQMAFGGWGVFLTMPVWLLGLAGLLRLLRTPARRDVALLCLVELAASGAVAFLFPEYRLSAYGYRTLVGAQVFLIPGVVHVLASPWLRSWRRVLCVTLLVAWQYLLVLQYPLPNDPDPVNFVGQAVRALPDAFVEQVLLRSSCLPRVLQRSLDADALRPLDWAYMVGLPALYGVVPLACLLALLRLLPGPTTGDASRRALRALGAVAFALVLVVEVLLLRGVAPLPPAERATRLLASARRQATDPLMALGFFTHERTAGWVDEARRLAPAHPDLAFTEAVREAALGDPARALSALERVARPDDPDAAYAVAMALRRAGSPPEDLTRALERAMALDPRHLRARVDAWNLLLSQGRAREAERALVEGIRLCHHFPLLRRELDEGLVSVRQRAR